MTVSDDRFYRRGFALVTAVLLAAVLFMIVRPFLQAILWSMLIAFLLHPVHRMLTARVGGRPGLSAILLTLATAIVLIAPLPLLSVAFASQAGELFGRLQRLVTESGISGAGDLLEIPIVSRAIRWASAIAPVTPEQIQDWLMAGVRTLLQSMVGISGAFVVGAVNALVGLAVTLFVLFFFLRDGEIMVVRAVRLIPMAPERRDRLVEHVGAVIRAVVFGALLTGVVQGVLVGVGFALVGLPSPVVFGALTAVAAPIPLIGPALVWVPAVVTLFVQARWIAGLFLLGWGVAVVSSVDNVVRPLVISGRAQISTLPVFVGLLGGISAFGAIGLVVGPVVVALALALLRFAVEVRGR
ncbi:MAG TPA: AI-2E family transporter [Methylomirabilota bacterium]|nr:AI-2E family transporter [Methylomirabilota bacterium]